MSNNTLALLIFISASVFINYFIYQKNKNKPKIFLIMVASLFGTMFLLTAGMYTSTRQNARLDLKTELNKIDRTIAVVTIDDELTAINNQNIIKEMMLVDNYMAHHSNPTRKFKFVVRDSINTIKFDLARDSQNRNEYWVSINNYEIGKVRTLIFKDLEKKLNDR